MTRLTYLSQAVKAVLFTMTIPVLSHATEDVTSLDTITITADQAQQEYKVKSNATALKLDLSLKETPQTVSIVTNQQMQDQNLDTLGEVLNQVVGVSSVQYATSGADDSFNSYYARGFTIDNYQIDGVNTTSAAIGGTTSLNTAAYENITVLKGATGLLSGVGNPSATINMNRKKPTSAPQTQVNLEYGSWNKIRTDIDVSGPLNQSNTVRGRVVAAYEDYDSFQDRAEGHQALIYGIVEADITEQTKVNVGIDAYLKENDAMTSHGFNILDITQTQKTPFNNRDNLASNWSYDDASRINLFGGIEHQFKNGWEAGLNLGYSKVDSDIVYGMAGRASVDLNADTMQFRADKVTNSPEQWNFDAYAKGTFQLLNREHDLAFGVTGYDMKQRDKDWSVTGVPSSVSISNWNGDVAHPTFQASGDLNQDKRQITTYGALRLNPLDRLHIILGGSFNNWEYTSNFSKDTKETGEFVPYAGLVFDLTDQWSVYGSYTTIFKPQSSRDFSGNVLEPLSGDTYEIGIKSDLFDRLNMSLSAFSTRQDNVAIEAGQYTQEDFDSGLIPGDMSIDDSYYRAGKGVKSQGIEFEVSGEILPNWNVSGGYSYVDTKDKNERINTNLPQNQIKLFTSYKFSGALENLTVGAGLRWQSDIYASEKERNLYKQDSYTLVDLMARYKVSNHISLGLNVANLTDEDYLVGTMSRSNVWGAPRSFTGSIHFKH